eukprot:TRINITY_DN7553_c0_g1_i1.p1 TRINITY_DN7553_c0_g1~~TRINITY_DN7553_c0_g1_i1.p1  ORF type:complete len:161 (+),score=30.19 TRINITY_DN7553_c0_g1_i1:59-484(+)
MYYATKVKRGMMMKQPLSPNQLRYFWMCISCLVFLVISDIVTWPNLGEQLTFVKIYGGEFDGRSVQYLKISCPSYIVHISISFVYLHVIVRFVLSSRQPLTQKSLTLKPKAATTTTNSQPKVVEVTPAQTSTSKTTDPLDD